MRDYNLDMLDHLIFPERAGASSQNVLIYQEIDGYGIRRRKRSTGVHNNKLVYIPKTRQNVGESTYDCCNMHSDEHYLCHVLIVEGD